MAFSISDYFGKLPYTGKIRAYAQLATHCFQGYSDIVFGCAVACIFSGTAHACVGRSGGKI